MGRSSSSMSSNPSSSSQYRIRRSSRWRFRQLATAAVVSSSMCHAFVSSSGPLRNRMLSSLASSSLLMEAPTCQLEDGKMFLSGNAMGSFTTEQQRYGGHAVSSTTNNDEEEKIMGFTTHPQGDESVYKDSSSPIKNQLASSIFRRQQETTLLPPWFPWLPTLSQIQMLKVTELKEACKERNLKRTGNKLTLQTRLWKWTQLQHQKRIQHAPQRPSAMDMNIPLQDMYSTPRRRRRSSSGSDNVFRRKESNNDDRPLPSRKESNEDAVPAQRRQLPRDANVFRYRPRTDDNDTDESSHKTTPSKKQPDSLADWARNLDLKPLLNRRRDIRRQAQEGKKKIFRQVPKPDLHTLTDALEAPPSLYSNLEVKQMYAEAKKADQAGDRQESKSLLTKLKEATPHDARIFKRLARMCNEEGRVDEARKHLQEGLRVHPDNGFLWHGLGQLELQADRVDEARRCFQKAIQVDPSLPHPYHAYGTLEHSHGRIAAAMKILQQGIGNCPTNHRLHHAMGDLYREAKLLELAETSYRKSLEFGNPVNHGFAYTALAYVAYEKGSLDECRHWLKEATSLNDGRNSRSWVAWGQMEEAEGHVDAARAVYKEALAQYEHGLIQRNARHQHRSKQQKHNKSQSFQNGGITWVDDSSSPKSLYKPSDSLASLKTKLLKRVPSYRSGDKFVNVYRNWARLEERYGTEEAVNEVYTRATTAFPRDHQLVLHWAQYHAKHGKVERARELFEQACRKVSNWHADPYREYGEFEISLGNYSEARSILYRGAQAMSVSPDGGLGNRSGMAQLFHTWAICEWYLDNLVRAEVLFDHALRLADGGHAGSKIRSYILYSVARLEYHRGEYELAQHCVALCLKENVMPGGNSKTWSLWAEIATAMRNDHLAKECTAQAAKVRKDEENGGVEGLSRLLGLTRPGGKSSAANGPAMQHLMRRDPWNHKIFGQSHMAAGGFDGVTLPEMPRDD